MRINARRLRSSHIPLSTTFTALALVVAGCAVGNEPTRGHTGRPPADSDISDGEPRNLISENEPARTSYCADEQRRVLPESDCDGDDDHNRYIYIGRYGSGYRPGSRLPATAGEQKIAAMDQAARIRAGIPARGGFGTTSGSVAG
ncbi:hypothetical protein OG777_17370 [Micromonospora peucetia]|uniref:hypothetical protein n=1 Tax=Micromonospora peucetia TaxID=47871 RepID=UPI00224EFFCE|nr:hypothetical protein [Micromonospora peucetia]MCX4388693.1 hypothetical protein [Micromonospora peucetia]